MTTDVVGHNGNAASEGAPAEERPTAASVAGERNNTCITCGDVALPLTVIEVLDDDRARCAAADGGVEEVVTELVGEVNIGTEVLVHAQIALAVLGEPKRKGLS